MYTGIFFTKDEKLTLPTEYFESFLAVSCGFSVPFRRQYHLNPYFRSFKEEKTIHSLMVPTSE